MVRWMGRLALVAVLGLSTAVLAQDEENKKRPGGPPRGFGGPGGPGGAPGMGRGMGMMRGGDLLGVLRNENVRKSVGLSEDESGMIELYAEERRDEDQKAMQEMQNLSVQERFTKGREAMEKRNKEVEKQLTEIIGEDKVKRLKQVQLQLGGLGAALMNPEIASKLKITDDQREQLREVAGGMREGMAKLQEAGDDQETRNKVWTQVRKEQETKLMEVLTADQKKAWGDMIGAPIDFAMPAPPRMDMRRGGPGGPGGPDGKNGEGRRMRRGRDRGQGPPGDSNQGKGDE